MVGVAGLFACSSRPPAVILDATCENDSTKPCTCPNGSKSARTCIDGEYSDCACSTGTADAGRRPIDATGTPDIQATGDAGGKPTGDAGGKPTDDAGGKPTGDAGGKPDTTSPPDAGGAMSCKSDKDCAASFMVCDPLAKVCVSCLTDAECATSQHCVALTCEAYTACSNSLACKAAVGPNGKAQPICDKTTGECTACVIAADCPASNDCKNKQCSPFKSCKNSTDCGTDQVCNKSTSRCVQCLGDNDCAANQLCESGTCRGFVPCSSDKQCTPVGMLCDAAKGKCAVCLENADCPTIYNCQPVGVANTGVCVLDVCAPGQGACNNNAKVTCNAIGDGFGTPSGCQAKTTCVAPGGKPHCKPWVCSPGQGCDGDKAVECSDDGLEVIKSVDCALTKKKCSAGTCKSLVCSPATQYCDGSEVKQCAADGLSGTKVKTCGAEEFCVEGACKKQLCVPGKPACDGQTATTCDNIGKGYTGAKVDCKAAGKVCDAGLCKSLLCSPATQYCDGSEVKQCAADGLSGTKVKTCGGGEFCHNGACKTQLCAPGKPACDGQTATMCDSAGKGYTGAKVDCKAQGKSCFNGSCTNDVDADKDGFPSSVDCDDKRSYLHPYDRDGDGKNDGCGWVDVSVESPGQGPVTCAIDSDLGVRCWGPASAKVVADAPGVGQFTQISLSEPSKGGDVACALATSGKVTCWGDNKHITDSQPAGTFTTLDCGLGHCCAVDTAGKLLCWGAKTGYSAAWQAGYSANAAMKAVSAGVYNDCGLDPTGQIKCWGKSDKGAINSPSGNGYIAVGAGYYAGCALDPSGKLKCWGDAALNSKSLPSTAFSKLFVHRVVGCVLNATGMPTCWTGHGDANYQNIVSQAPKTTELKTIGIGFEHACGVTKMGGLVCWGNAPKVVAPVTVP